MRLYYRPRTGRPMRVAWALEEIGAPYEAVRVTAAEAATPEHRARHPLCRVPALELDGEVLFESTALVLALADRYPGAELIPEPGSPERGLVYQWSLAAMTELERAVSDHLVGRATLDTARSLGGRERYGAPAAMFEAALAGREFLVGEALTVADIVAGGVASLARWGGMLHDGLPALGAYVERLSARPAFQRAVAVTESLLAT